MEKERPTSKKAFKSQMYGIDTNEWKQGSGKTGEWSASFHLMVLFVWKTSVKRPFLKVFIWSNGKRNAVGMQAVNGIERPKLMS